MSSGMRGFDAIRGIESPLDTTPAIRLSSDASTVTQNLYGSFSSPTSYELKSPGGRTTDLPIDPTTRSFKHGTLTNFIASDAHTQKADGTARPNGEKLTTAQISDMKGWGNVTTKNGWQGKFK